MPPKRTNPYWSILPLIPLNLNLFIKPPAWLGVSRPVVLFAVVPPRSASPCRAALVRTGAWAWKPLNSAGRMDSFFKERVRLDLIFSLFAKRTQAFLAKKLNNGQKKSRRSGKVFRSVDGYLDDRERRKSWSPWFWLPASSGNWRVWPCAVCVSIHCLAVTLTVLFGVSKKRNWTFLTG